MKVELYDVDVRTINEKIKTIFNDGELVEDSVIRKYRITASIVQDRLYQSDFDRLIQLLDSKENNHE